MEAIGNLGNNMPMPEFERQIAESPDGLLVTWNELCELSEKLKEVINVVIIGYKNRRDIQKHHNERELLSSCDIVIEAFDSSYWRVYAKDQAVIDRIEESFNSTEIKSI